MFPLSPYHLPKPHVEVRHSVNEISKSVRSAFTIRESCLLHILPLMLTSLHICETGRMKPQESLNRTSAKYTQQHSWVFCGSTFQLH